MKSQMRVNSYTKKRKITKIGPFIEREWLLKVYLWERKSLINISLMHILSDCKERKIHNLYLFFSNYLLSMNQKNIFYYITQSTIYLTSFHRASILALSIRTTKNYKLRPFRNFSTEAAKHGPAFGVIPVFMPDHPYLNILFVFYHLSTYFILFVFWENGF